MQKKRGVDSAGRRRSSLGSEIEYFLPYSSHKMIEVIHGRNVVIVRFKFNVWVDFSVQYNATTQ